MESHEIPTSTQQNALNLSIPPSTPLSLTPSPQEAAAFELSSTENAAANATTSGLTDLVDASLATGKTSSTLLLAVSAVNATNSGLKDLVSDSLATNIAISGLTNPTDGSLATANTMGSGLTEVGNDSLATASTTVSASADLVDASLATGQTAFNPYCPEWSFEPLYTESIAANTTTSNVNASSSTDRNASNSINYRPASSVSFPSGLSTSYSPIPAVSASTHISSSTNFIDVSSVNGQNGSPQISSRPIIDVPVQSGVATLPSASTNHIDDSAIAAQIASIELRQCPESGAPLTPGAITSPSGSTNLFDAALSAAQNNSTRVRYRPESDHAVPPGPRISPWGTAARLESVSLPLHQRTNTSIASATLHSSSEPATPVAATPTISTPTTSAPITAFSTPKCHNCFAPAMYYCDGCYTAPPLEGEDAEGLKTWYCRASCQDLDWRRHKLRCYQLQSRADLYRAGNLLQALFYKYREILFDNLILKVEKDGQDLNVHEGQYAALKSDLDEYHYFPYELFENSDLGEKDKHALLVAGQSDTAIIFFLDIVWHLVRDVTLSMEDVCVFSKNPLRKLFHFGHEGNEITTDGYHSFYEITLKYGKEKYILDLTGAQFGYHQPITPSAEYFATRVSSVIRRGKSGVYRDKCIKECTSSKELVGVNTRNNEWSSVVLNRAILDWEKRSYEKNSVALLCRASEKAFEAGKKDLVEKVGRVLFEKMRMPRFKEGDEGRTRLC